MDDEPHATDTSDDEDQPSDLREHIDEAKGCAGIEPKHVDVDERAPQPGLTPSPEPEDE